MIVAKSPKTAWQIIEGEAVLLSMDTKVLRGLNPVGSRIWELIDGQRSLEEITGVIVQEPASSAVVAAPVNATSPESVPAVRRPLSVSSFTKPAISSRMMMDCRQSEGMAARA